MFTVRPEVGPCSCGNPQLNYHFQCPQCGKSFCCGCYRTTARQGEAKCPSCECVVCFASRSPTTPRGHLTGPPEDVFAVPKNIYTVFHRYGMTGGLVMLRIIERERADQLEIGIPDEELMAYANANAADVHSAICRLKEDGLIPKRKEPLDRQ